MLNIKDLKKQYTFFPYKNDDGTITEWYNEHFDFVIKIYDNDHLVLAHHSEIEGDTWNIKKLKSLDDLKNVYEAITDKNFK